MQPCLIFFANVQKQISLMQINDEITGTSHSDLNPSIGISNMIRALSIFTLAALALSACTPQPSSVSGKHLYDKHCTSCHGRTAQGDGPRAVDFGIPPSDLTLISQRNGGAFPMADVMAQINGYTGRHQLGGMPEFEQDLKGPTVQWTDAFGVVTPTPTVLLEIAKYLESIQQ